MLGKTAQMCQSAVVFLALSEQGRKEIGDVLHEIGKAFELSVLVSGDGGRRKSKDDTDEPSDVGGVVDAVELDHMFSSGES